MRFSACMQQVASAIQFAVHGLFACFAAVDQRAIERVDAEGLPLWIYGQCVSINGICQVGFIALHGLYSCRYVAAEAHIHTRWRATWCSIWHHVALEWVQGGCGLL